MPSARCRGQGNGEGLLSLYQLSYDSSLCLDSLLGVQSTPLIRISVPDRRGIVAEGTCDCLLSRLRREVSAAPRARRRATREIGDSETSGIRTRILPVDNRML